MSAAVTARAPAKVNLVLKVGDPRPDGFHELATVFAAVGLEEQVSVADGPAGVRVTVDGEGARRVPIGPANLAARAVRALADVTGIDLSIRGVDVAIRKRVPVAAGLAGGSADAAATLVALDALWGTALDGERLRVLAAGLGSDVPFGLVGGTAVGTGRGHLLDPVVGPGNYSWVLAFAAGELSTPRVFAELDRMRAAAPGGDPAVGAPGPGAPTVSPVLLDALRTGDAPAVGELLDNDLQAPALSLMPSLRACLQVGSERGALGAVVSGSGPTCAFLAADSGHGADLAAALTAAGVCRAAVSVPGPVTGASLLA